MRTKFITILLGCLTFALLVALLVLTMTGEPAYAQASSLASNICLSPIEGPVVGQPMIGVDLPALEREIWWGLNRERLKAHLFPLGLRRDLTSVAIYRSRDMIERGYFSHQMPGGKMVWDLLDEKGISGPYSYVGEIIARTEINDAAQIVKAWMDSPAHRYILTRGYYTWVGVGLATDPNGKKYITAIFMGESNR